jgi:hypothetical protein
MKSRFWFYGILIAGLLVATGTVRPQEKADKPATAEMQEWMKLTLPGEHHKHLEALAGKWNLVVKFKAEPEAAWEESKGMADYKPILGSRFVAENAQCEVFGQPFEWMGFLGYDNHKKKHIAVWVDNFGTGTEYAEGECDLAGQVITYLGEQEDPQTGGKSKYKWVITVESNDKMMIEMYQIDDTGKEFKNMEIVGTRTT